MSAPLPDPKPLDPTGSADAVFESVAELFSLLSTPIRLKIIGALCHGEKNVSQLLAEIKIGRAHV